MFEVNFFEKKQRNLLPHLMSGIFAILFIAMGIYFFLSYTHYVQTDETNKNWLREEADQLAISRQMEKYDQLTKRLTENKAIFEGKQYPMSGVVRELAAQVPNEEESISIFGLNESNQATLVLEKMSIDEISETINRFNELPYIKNTHLIRIENQTSEPESLVELRVELDEEILREEVRP